RGDATRAEEFVESAFEVALEHAAEARALESALKARGRVELLSRALEARLKETLGPLELCRALASLVQLSRDGHVEGLDREVIARHAETALAGVSREENVEADVYTGLAKVFDFLGDRAREAEILEKQVQSWTEQGEAPDDPEAFYRLAAARLGS